MYPALQLHSYEFAPVSVHEPAVVSPQGAVAQSLMSKQLMPLPLKPAGHASQVKPSAGAGSS
jgi:hypothetical protein